jgi:hypothetical protein
LPCHPKDHWEDDPIGLLTFFGLGNSVALWVIFPAGISSIIVFAAIKISYSMRDISYFYSVGGKYAQI